MSLAGQVCATSTLVRVACSGILTELDTDSNASNTRKFVDFLKSLFTTTSQIVTEEKTCVLMLMGE